MRSLSRLCVPGCLVEVPPASDPSDAIAVVGDSVSVLKAIQLVMDKVRRPMRTLPCTCCGAGKCAADLGYVSPYRRGTCVDGTCQSKSVAFEEIPISSERLQRYLTARSKAKLRELEKDRKSTVTFNGTAVELQGPPEEAAALHADASKLVKALVRIARPRRRLHFAEAEAEAVLTHSACGADEKDVRILRVCSAP